MSEPRDDAHLELRASDADRDATSAVIAAAAADGRLTLEELHERLDIVYAARTHGELAALTRDLGPAQRPPTAIARPTYQGQIPHPSYEKSTQVAILSGFDRKGVWTVPAHWKIVAVMGGADLDFTDAVFEARECELNVVAIMGGVNIVVPPHVRIECDVKAILGGSSNKAADGPGEHVVRVTGVAIMGGVDIKRAPRERLGRPPAPPLPPGR